MQTKIPGLSAAAGFLLAGILFTPQAPAAADTTAVILTREDVMSCDAPSYPPAEVLKRRRSADFGRRHDAAYLLPANIYDLADCFRRKLEST